MKFVAFVAGGIAAGCLSMPALAQDVPATATTAVVAQPVPTVGPGSTLPANTDIWLSLDRKLDSHDVKVGDPIAFKVARDVMVGNFIVVPRGTPATGHITLRSGRGAFGKSAKIEFDLDTISLNGRAIPVSGHYKLSGDGNTGATLGAVALAGVVGGLFVKGRSAVAAEGSEWKASTREALPITY